jgi:hypothetical protein
MNKVFLSILTGVSVLNLVVAGFNREPQCVAGWVIAVGMIIYTWVKEH